MHHPTILNLFELILFKGKTHLKRGFGITRVPEKLIEQYYPIIYDENTVNSDDQCQRQTPKYIENIKLELNDIFYKYINSN